ncbi:hypothetical protein TrispH2_004982 [Trichoplax sp. H2]|nr:hypothetical protein TrispH2_004982 [Trichoplax sp. H2]|eukprot:RDD43535.1 hypothetical protein TrispH2_004982 [Trichoplax sp. H2]
MAKSTFCGFLFKVWLFQIMLHWTLAISTPHRLTMNKSCGRKLFLHELRRTVMDTFKNISKINCQRGFMNIMPLNISLTQKRMKIPDLHWNIDQFNALIDNITYNIGVIVTNGSVLSALKSYKGRDYCNPCQIDTDKFREQHLRLMAVLIKFRHPYHCLEERFHDLFQQIQIQQTRTTKFRCTILGLSQSHSEIGMLSAFESCPLLMNEYDGIYRSIYGLLEASP